MALHFIPYSPTPQSDPQSPPDYRFERVTMRSFPLPAPYAAVKKICDDYINAIAIRDNLPLRIEPLTLPYSPYAPIMVSVLRYGRMYSQARAAEGFSKQNELVFEIPIVIDDPPNPPKIGFFVPYVFVDNDWSIASGRDVMGYPKLQGFFSPSGSAPTKVEVLAIHPFGNEAAPLTLLDISGASLPTAQRTTVGPGAGPEPGHTISDEVRELWPFGPLDGVFRDSELYRISADVLRLMRQTAGIEISHIALKQFRDAENTDMACYQALVEFKTVVDRVYAGGLLPSSTTLDLYSYDSVDIPGTFGFTTQKQNPLFPWWFEADFVLENVKVRHAVCGDEITVPREIPVDELVVGGELPRPPPPPNGDPRIGTFPWHDGEEEPPVPGHVSCWDLMEDACQLTHSVLNQQAETCRAMTQRLRSGDVGEREVAGDVKQLARNALVYYGDLAELWLSGLSGMLVRR
jgi:hypothetical protein